MPHQIIDVVTPYVAVPVAASPEVLAAAREAAGDSALTIVPGLVDTEVTQQVPPAVASAMAGQVLTGAETTVTEGAEWDVAVSIVGGTKPKFNFTVPPGGTAYWLGSLTASSQLDSLSTGVAGVPSGEIASAVGLPDALDGYVQTSAYGTAQAAIQTFTARTIPPRVWQRVRSAAGVWQAWSRTDMAARDQTGSPLTESSTVASLGTGMYSINSDAVAASLAMPAALAGILEVWLISAASGQQQYRTGTGEIYRRTLTSSGWSAWSQVQAGTMNASQDLHTLTEGTWRLISWPTDWQAQHFPAYTRGVVTVRQLASYRILTMDGLDIASRWQRVISSTGTTAWTRMLTTSDALSTTPDYATQSRSWTPALSAYNAESPVLRTIRALIQDGLAGRSDVRIMACGDSKTFGSGIGDPNAPIEEGSMSPVVDAWPQQLAELLGARTDMIYAVAPGDPRWSYNGITTPSDPSRRYAQGTGTLQLVTTSPHTGAIIYLHAEAATTVTATIDGMDTSLTVPAGGGWTGVPITGLTDSTHTIRLSATSDIYVLGIRQTYTTPGLGISNAGRSSSTAQHWMDGGDWWDHWHTAIAFPGDDPDVLILALGTNQPNDLDSLTTLTTQVADTHIPTLVIAPGGLTSNTANRAMWAHLYDLATTHDWALVDHQAILGDTVHENARGHTLEAANLTRLIRP